MDNQIREAMLFKRIKESESGLEFIELLKELSSQNYRAYKHDQFELNDIHKGYAICIDFLIESFEQCEQVIEKSKKKHLFNVI